MLEGSSLMLRPIRRSDIPAFLVWYNDMEVLQYLGQNLLKSEMDEEKYVEELTGDATRINLVIETRDTGSPRAIGNVGFEMINYRDRQATFGIAIGEKDCWNKGYGTEAAGLLLKYGFEELNFNRINSNVYAFNQRSRQLHLKLGFKEEGCRRQAKYINGDYHDIIEYGLLMPEWLVVHNNFGGNACT